MSNVFFRFLFIAFPFLIISCPKNAILRDTKCRGDLDFISVNSTTWHATCSYITKDIDYECEKISSTKMNCEVIEPAVVPKFKIKLPKPPEPPKPQKRMVEFNSEEYKKYETTGAASIIGQAFTKTLGGDVKYGAGNEIKLFPITSYSTEAWDRAIIGGELLEPSDENSNKYTKVTIADGQGNFKFKNLPPGDYYIYCVITWQVALSGKLTMTGGIVGSKIKIEENENKEIILPLLKSL